MPPRQCDAAAASPGDPTVTGLWVMDADGSNQRRLADGRGWGTIGWSPDGERIAAWNQPLTGATSAVVTVTADGSDRRRTFPLGPDVAPEGLGVENIAWSRDGSKLFLNVMRIDEQGQTWDRYAVNDDGSGRTMLAEGTDINRPVLSPGGSKIAFTGADQQLYVANVDSSNRVRLTGGTSAASAPAWSPDGTLIAFSSSAFATGQITSTRIEVIHPDGTGRRVVAAGEGMFYGNPAWSTNGDWVSLIDTSTKTSAGWP